MGAHLKPSFTELEKDRYKKLCGFTEQEEQVFDLVMKGESRVGISMQMKLSLSTVNRRIKSIKDKMKRV